MPHLPHPSHPPPSVQVILRHLSVHNCLELLGAARGLEGGPFAELEGAALRYAVSRCGQGGEKGCHVQTDAPGPAAAPAVCAA